VTAPTRGQSQKHAMATAMFSGIICLCHYIRTCVGYSGFSDLTTHSIYVHDLLCRRSLCMVLRGSEGVLRPCSVMWARGVYTQRGSDRDGKEVRE